jgi:SAM-dependent methyltransferase
MSVADAAFRREVGAAYATAALAWASGAGFVYARLAEALVTRLPTVDNGLVLDLCAGTGAATAPLLRRGCVVIAVDLVPDMLVVNACERPPAVAADAFALPFRDGSLAAVVVACGLNHAPDPVAFLAESRRVTRVGGVVLASTFAEGWSHPVKIAVDRALQPFGFQAPSWYDRFKRAVEPATATAESLTSIAKAAGLRSSCVVNEDVVVDATIDQAVEWRLSMASHAGFMARLSMTDQRLATAAAVSEVTDKWQPLVVPLLILSASA